MNIPFQRLHNQRLLEPSFETPADVVQWFGAVQSQDYPAAKWAVAQRTGGLNDAAIEQAYNEGKILRLHVLRPTWHFVTAEDIRWMLELTGARVLAATASYFRQLELDAAICARSNDIIAKALQGGNHLTREEIGTLLEQEGISTAGLRLGHLASYAELTGLICSGAMRGKQFTYALIDERAPQAKRLTRDETLAELAKRFFVSHGPATLKDYVWWSGLTVGDAKAGLEAIKSQLIEETIGDQTYWFSASEATSTVTTPTAYLLPNYDEYLVAYTDRSAIYGALDNEKLDARGNVLFNHTLVVDGQVVGTWKRTFKKGSAVITLTYFRSLTDVESQAVNRAVERYSEFLGMPVVVS
jgi:hypothetical protein